MSRHDSNNGSQFSFEESVDFSYLLASAYAMCFLPFLRVSFGKEGLGMPAVLALLLLLVAIMFSGEPAMVLFLLLWLSAVIVQRFITFRNWFQGWRVHTYYRGYPWFARLMNPFTTDERQLLMLEPLSCFALAVPASASQSGFVVSFVLLGAVAIAIKNGLELEIRRRQIEQLEDAEIEHQSLLDEWDEHRRRWS